MKQTLSWVIQLLRLLLSYPFNRVLLIGSPEHGNLGDHAISIAERKLLKNNHIFCTEISGGLYRRIKKRIIPFVKKSDVIGITGGGFLGSLWKLDDDMVNDVILRFPNNRIIIFPQTVFFNVENDKDNFIKTYSSHKDLHIFLRENNSYTLIKSLLGSKCCVYLVPDMVLSLDTSNIRTTRQNIVLLCLREDKESVLNSENKLSIEKIVKDADYTIRHITTISPKRILFEERDNEVRKLLLEIKSSRLIITDRLHAMIFAYITGTPCYVFDNLSHKVSGVYQWIKNCDFIHYTDTANFNNIDFSLLPDNPQLFKKEFYKLIEVIKGKK